MDQFEESSGELDAQLATWSNQLLSGQESRNALVEQISQSQSNVALHQSRSDDLQIQSNGQRQLLERTSERLQQIEVRRQQSVEQLAAARQTCAEAKQRLIQTDLDIDQARNQIKQLRDDNQRQHDEKDKTTGLISELEKEISAANSQSAMTAKSKNRLTTVCNELDATIAQQTAAHKQHENEQKRLEEVATEKDSALKDARSRLQEKRDALANAQKQLAEERRAQTGASQRAEVIQELENKLEGVDTGVKQLLNQAQADPSDALKDIVGLVADLIKVNVQHAELVDLALGDYAHSLVVDGNQLITEILTGKRKLGGRVRIIQLRHPPTLGAASKLDLHHNEGVVGRLDQLVQADSEFAEFTSSLLGGTWLVKTMRDAIHLRRQHSRSVRFVTLQGDVLEADGTLVAGPRSAVVGIVSRRSELRSLNREITRLQAKIDHEKSQIQSLSRETRELEEQAERLLNDHTEIASQLTNERALAKSVESRLGQLNKQRTESGIELDETTKALASFESQLATDRANLAERQNQLEIIVAAIAKNDHALDQLQLQQADKQKLQTTLKVNLAKAEQHHVDLENADRQLDEQLAEGQTTIRQTRDALAQMLWHGRSSKREVRESSNLLVELEYEKSIADAKINELTQQRSATENRRRELAGQINAARDDIRNWKDSVHDIELKEKQLSLERQQLAERLRDDYQIDISTLEQESQEIDENRDAIDKEISDLRRAIGNIGSVNMDALIELEETQERYETLDAQYQDLVNSKQALEKIIQKINNDSRRLFAETLEAIRLNFQKLFRQTFGGGRADLVMEEDVDILEAGIDIVATPPGKPQFNNSLLSGGERALTAVSLLMAIFQFRPSPFCVLDEVDAPFDAANIGRFIEVLRSFLDWSKFVIVTHSKITMTAATTLYGVTMQESGVSKRVSVRFEDVNEEGEISKDALDRQSESDDQRTVA